MACMQVADTILTELFSFLSVFQIMGTNRKKYMYYIKHSVL